MDDQKFTSSDLPLVALLSLTHPIEKVDRSVPKKFVFYFVNTAELQKKIAAFNNKKLKVEPQIYYEQIRAVKKLIYARDEPKGAIPEPAKVLA